MGRNVVSAKLDIIFKKILPKMQICFTNLWQIYLRYQVKAYRK